MVNSIAPHGPPVQPDPSGVPVSIRDKGGGSPSFDDFLSDQPSKETPSPIEDHSPPVLTNNSLGETPALDPIRGTMPRPIRWKEGKTSAPGATPGAGILQPNVPLPTQIDPQLMATTIALSPSWSPLSPPSQDNEAAATETSSAQNTTVAQASTSKQTPSPIEDHSPPVLPDTTPAETPTPDPIRGTMPRPILWKKNQTSDTAGTNAVFTSDTLLVQASASSGMIRRISADGLVPSTDPAVTNIQAPPAVGTRQAAPVNRTPSTPPDLTLSPGLLDAAQALSIPAVAVPSASPVAAKPNAADIDQVLPLSPAANASVSIPTTGTESISMVTDLPVPANPALPTSSSPMDSREMGTDLVLPLPTARDLSTTLPSTDLRIANTGPALPLPAFRDLSTTFLSADTGSVDANSATMPPGTGFSLPVPVADSRLVAPVAPPVGATPPPPVATTLTAPVADSRVAIRVVSPVPVETTLPVATMTQGATVTLSAPDTQTELSAPSIAGQAKIAGSSAPEMKFAGELEYEKPQTAVVEQINLDSKSDGTPVAKDESVVNATFTADEKENDVSPPSKRGNATVPGTPASNRAANSHSQGGETLVGVSVFGPAKIDGTTTPVTQATAPDPTAARQAVKVETLLQHTLNAGESVRPNGSNQMEMRVRLDGGHEDVTVRMQVVNDRMQVTFQTNSPELRKALEHGWEQFSTGAAQTSTLSMSEPRFEGSRAAGALPTGQSDAQAFSSNQQNSRRQETPATFADESAASLDPRRAGFATAATATPAAGQPAVRRWSGWA